MSVKNITPSLIKRVAPYRGPRSSDSWNDTIDEIATDIASITLQWNTEIVPLLAGLPDGTVDANLNAFTNGLDGAQLYVDQNATVNSDNGEYWDITNGRPTTTKETFDSIRAVIDENFATLTALVADSTGGLTQEQKNAIGLEIFADDFVFSGVSIYTRGFTNQYNIQQLATDIYGGSVVPDGTGNPALTNSIKDMLGNLLLEHNGSWSGDAVVSHSITNSDIGANANITQTKIDHSLAYDDSYAGVVGNLEDDFNKVRTILKAIKGSTGWDVAVSPGYSGGPITMLDHFADHGTGVATATNPHGYKLEDIDQTNFLREFTGQDTSSQNAPIYLSFNAISTQGVPLETALNDIDDEIGTIQTNISSNDTDIAELESFTGVDPSAGVFPDYGGTANYATGSLENAIEIIDGVLFTAVGDISVLETSSGDATAAIVALQGDVTDMLSFIGAADGDTVPTYSSALIVTQNTPLESAIGELDSQLDTTGNNLSTHESDTGNPHSVDAADIGSTAIINEINTELTAVINWARLNKTGSSLADLDTRNHSQLTGIGVNSHTTIDSTLSALISHDNNYHSIDFLNTEHKEGYTSAVSGGPFLPSLEHWASDIEVEDFYAEFTESTVEMVLHEVNVTAESANVRGDGWDDINVSGLSLEKTGPNQPSVSNYRDNINLLAFDNSTMNEGWTTIHIPHEYEPGTTIFPHVHWTHNNGSPSGNVAWKLEYTVAKGFGLGTFGASTTISATSTADAQYVHTIEEFATGIPSTNLEPDSTILVRVYRDAGSDTFGDDAFLIALDIHFECDGRRTNEKDSPFTKI